MDFEARKSSWRDARADESDGLENRCVARHRGFESHSLRASPGWLSGSSPQVRTGSLPSP
jgi:hypothetical protein